MRYPHDSAGWTLKEMMIALMIVGILAAIVIPNYQKYIRNTRIEQAKAALLENATHLEQFYAQNKSFKINSTTWANLAITQTEHFCIRFHGAPRSDKETHFILKAVAFNPKQEPRVITIDEDQIILMCESSTSSCDEDGAFFKGSYGRTDKNCVAIH